MSELTDRSAGELMDDLRARRVSARELLDASVARHEAVHAELNAVVATDLDRAYDEAAAVDDARARGAELGPLGGLPMTVKDGFDVRGMPATSGNPSFAHRPPDCADAAVVAAVRDAGAIVWGKTNVPLMLGDMQTFNDVYGTTNNPYDTTRTPGGSSGGAAAAVAAGVTSLEIGSDIGGSLRHPANFCGIHALKPTWGTLSLRGSVPPPPGRHLETDLAVAGPMARTAADLRLLYGVLRPDVPAAERAVAGARIAVWLEEPEFALGSEARAAVERAAQALRERGAVVEFASPPIPAADLLDTYLALLYAITAADYPRSLYARLAEARDDCVAAVESGASRYGIETLVVRSTASYRDVARAMADRQGLKDAVASWFGDWDAILAPVAPVPAFTHRQDGQVTAHVIDVDGAEVPYLHLFDWIALASALHLPALAAPVARTTDGLPIGVQLIGEWHNEDRLLDLADALERQCGGFRAPGR